MTNDSPRAALLQAALIHVPFDGWSDATYRQALQDTGIDPTLARAVCPRGVTDLAMDYHENGDQAMLAALATADLSAMRFRDRVAHALMLRLEASGDREVVRRAVGLFALPHLALDGSRMIWRTCDRIWTALGDTSDDVNWYTKRATLAGVYSASVLFWLGDTSEDLEKTRAFVDRRIDDVMGIEKIKATVRNNQLLSAMFAAPMAILGQIRAPSNTHDQAMPGRWKKEEPHEH